MSWLDDVLNTSVDELYKDWDYHTWCTKVGWMDGPISYACEWVEKNFEVGTEIADVACGNGQIGIRFNNNDYVIDGYDINAKMLDTFEATNYRDTTVHDMNESPLPKKYKCITVIGAFNKSHLQSGCAKMLYDSLQEGGMLIASVSDHDHEDPLTAFGWRNQEYLDIISEESVKSILTEDEGQQYHFMVVFKKK
jgi:2-polyprenyl-3-methyl-5-hydroxy-6-metoxy-1,4-benzoquinol methylase